MPTGQLPFMKTDLMNPVTLALALVLITGTVVFGASRLPVSVKYGSNYLDVYIPKDSKSSSKSRSVIVYVHGGAWKRGSRRSVGAKPGYFLNQGKLFVSVGYTLYPQANAMTQARQIGEAVRWVRNNISKYNGDKNRIFLMGHSAGCHLAALATFSGKASGVRGLICNDTRAYDLRLLANWNGGKIPGLYSALGNKSQWRNWSPISYIRKKRQPPVLIAWSRGKGRQYLSQQFANSLRQAGTRVFTFDGSRLYGHGGINRSIGSEGDGITAAINRFLQRLGG